MHWSALAMPVLRCLDPETAHRLTIAGLRLLPASTATTDDPILRTQIAGLTLPNPIGLAAGFDKHAEVPDALWRFGFGFLEVGGVTPRPQAGNPRPRVFRWPAREAVINRYGFNSVGLDAVASRLGARKSAGIVGVNLGKNKDQDDAAADYRAGVRRLAPLVDFLVINVSSPNTPGLRALQGRASLIRIVDEVLAEQQSGRPPLFLKVAPDISDDDIGDIAGIAVDCGIDGLIVANTTTSRPDDMPVALAAEAGGLSGPPVFALSTAVLQKLYGLTKGNVPLIGVGGISTGADAYAKIRAGAVAVQLYTALTYHGPGLVARIKDDLAALLRRDGFSTVAEAVGSGYVDGS